MLRARDFHKKEATIKVRFGSVRFGAVRCGASAPRQPAAKSFGKKRKERGVRRGSRHRWGSPEPPPCDRASPRPPVPPPSPLLLQQLRRKAEERNPDEFYFGMERARTKDGVHQAPTAQANKYSQEELRLMKTQDANYLSLKAQAEAKVGQWQQWQQWQQGWGVGR